MREVFRAEILRRIQDIQEELDWIARVREEVKDDPDYLRQLEKRERQWKEELAKLWEFLRLLG